MEIEIGTNLKNALYVLSVAFAVVGSLWAVNRHKED